MFIADTRTNCHGNSGGQLHDEWDNYSYTSTCAVGKREKRGEIGCEGRALACVRQGPSRLVSQPSGPSAGEEG